MLFEALTSTGLEVFSLMQGIHLINHAIYRTLEQGGQFVLLGTGHADGDFRHIRDHHLHNHKDARMMLMYSEQLAHMIYAAADIVLVPSLFEPCGEPMDSLLGWEFAFKNGRICAFLASDLWS